MLEPLTRLSLRLIKWTIKVLLAYQLSSRIDLDYKNYQIFIVLGLDKIYLDLNEHIIFIRHGLTLHWASKNEL